MARAAMVACAFKRQVFKDKIAVKGFEVEQALAGEAETKPQGYAEFRRGWKVVFASLMGIGLGLSPLPIYTIGVFAPHFMAEFGWSIAEIMAGITITTIALLGAGPLAGWLAGRFGVRPVVLVSLILFGLSFMGLGLSNGSLPLFYANWAVITLFGAGTLPITWTKAVNHWFDVRKGLALGLAMTGTGLFGILCKPFLAWLIPLAGWRTSYVVLGLLPILIAFPIAYFMFRDTDTHPDAPVKATKPGGLSFQQAIRDWRFWLLFVSFLPVSLALSGPVPNMENLLSNSGIDAATIVTLTPLIGFSAIVGRLAGGWLLDRFWAPVVGFILLSLPAIACFLFMQAGLTPGVAAIAIFLIGFALGIEYDLMAYLVARYFGLKAYSSIYSLLYISFAVGAGFGPLFFGWSFDRNGNYHAILFASCIMLVLSAALLLLLGSYRKFADEPLDGADNGKAAA